VLASLLLLILFSYIVIYWQYCQVLLMLSIAMYYCIMYKLCIASISTASIAYFITVLLQYRGDRGWLSYEIDCRNAYNSNRIWQKNLFFSYNINLLCKMICTKSICYVKRFAPKYYIYYLYYLWLWRKWNCWVNFSYYLFCWQVFDIINRDIPVFVKNDMS